LYTLKNIRKIKIKKAFSEASVFYHKNAELQKKTAARLARSVRPWKYTIPAGRVLEIGSGTGFFSEHLVKIFHDRELIITDLSEKMISLCKENVGNYKHVKFEVKDAENIGPDNNSYACIAGNFVAQWFRDPASTLDRLTEMLVPGGLLLMAFPGSESFPEWRNHCVELGLPYTANPLPDVNEIVIKLSMGQNQIDFYEDSYTESYQSAFHFFRHLKKIGVTTSMSGKSLSAGDFKKLVEYWDRKTENEITITYHLVFLAIKKN